MSTGTRNKNSSKEARANKPAKPSYHHGDLVRALITAGRDILVEKGTDGLSLRAVAARVGVSQTAPYSHFSSKRDLLRAISASGYAELADKMATNVKVNISAMDTALNHGVTYIEFAINSPDIYRLMFAGIDPNARSNHRNEIISRADILNKEATRAFSVLYDFYNSQRVDKKLATTLSYGTWGLVHGLASLITEGFIKIPKAGRKKYLRELLAGQMRIPE